MRALPSLERTLGIRTLTGPIPRSVSLVLASSRCVPMQPFHHRLGVDAETNTRSILLLPPDELIVELRLLTARSEHLKHSLYY